MSSTTPAPPPIPVETTRIEVLPRQAMPSAATVSPSAAGPKYWFHPLSGWLILAVDWLLFGPEAITASMASIFTGPLAFLITGTGVFLIQRRRNGDSLGSSCLKALLGAVLAAIPTPISGTILGTMVLLLSGLTAFNYRNPPGRP